MQNCGQASRVLDSDRSLNECITCTDPCCNLTDGSDGAGKMHYAVFSGISKQINAHRFTVCPVV